MVNQKHLTALDRITIENSLKKTNHSRQLAKNWIRIIQQSQNKSKRTWIVNTFLDNFYENILNSTGVL